MRPALFLLLAVLSPDGPPRLSQPQVVVQGGQVCVTVRLDNALHGAAVERIDSGLPSGFTFQFELLRDRKKWWDAGLSSHALQVTAMYNAVEKEYLVNYELDGKLIESRLARSHDELEAAMTEVERLPLYTVEEVPANTRLLIRVRVLLGARTLLSFIPTRVKTDWVASRKFTVPREPG